MKLSITITLALRALRRNKMRSVLTMLGIIIGVGAVIALVAIGNGAKSQVEGQISKLGENVILIFAGSTTTKGQHTGWGNAGTLKPGDAIAIRNEIQGVAAVSPQVRTNAQVTSANGNWYTSVLGVSPGYFDIRQWSIVKGSTFLQQNVRSASKVAVIGQTIVTNLYPNSNPLGQVIRIKNVPFIVVGVLKSRGLSVMGSDQDDVIYVPYTSAMKRLMGATSLRMINVQAESAQMMPEVQQQITGLLRQRHHLAPEANNDFTVRNQEEITEAATKTTQTLTVLLGAIASVSLLVGGIGIMNIMLVSVTERTREIGIRMAVGAHGSDILLQFLIEAITLSVLGGLIGIVIGVTISQVLAHFANWPASITLTPIIGAFCFSAVVGVFFGFYPARKAAAMDPIEALRYE